MSEDGHQWSNAAYATDFDEKAWTNSYSRRGEPDADELTISPAGYLWDACARHHLTFRTYGEMASFVSSPDKAPEVKAVGSLAGHVSLDWLKEKSGRDTDKAAVFIHELKEAEGSGDWPNFTVMSLGEDHTSGLKPKAFTPTAAVASNDEALVEMSRPSAIRGSGKRRLVSSSKTMRRTDRIMWMPIVQWASNLAVGETRGGGQHDVHDLVVCAHDGADPGPAANDPA